MHDPTGRSESAPDDHVAAIALSTISGLGPSRLKALTTYFGSTRKALQAPIDVLQRVPGIGRMLASQIASLDADAEVGRQLRIAKKVGAVAIAKSDIRYPPLLREIHDPPSFLWARGSSDVELHHAVAVVGSRRATRYGVEMASVFAGQLAGLGYTIVSGLAHGIDAAAHRGALAAGGKTVAVMGSGVDRIYPGANRSLFMQVLNSGAAFSEFPMGAAPDATNFPRRNRLISGMSLGVVVVEAYEEGGGLITAKFALDQNREVFCLPGPLTSKSSVGTNRMIRDGEAKLVTRVEDILDELPPGPELTRGRADGPVLSAEQKKIVSLITSGGTSADVISEEIGLDASHTLAALLTLEMKGMVRQGLGGLFYLVQGPAGS